MKHLMNVILIVFLVPVQLNTLKIDLGDIWTMFMCLFTFSETKDINLNNSGLEVFRLCVS